MPEYLTPAVYVEETSFRSKSIEGVPTSTFGMAGRTQYGPVPYKTTTPKVTMTPRPVLVTSFTEYERMFGGLSTAAGDTIYLAHAARSFFDNGGRRLYISRVHALATTPVNGVDEVDVDKNFAKLAVGAGNPPLATWRARWPGEAGRTISVKVAFVRSKNVLIGGSLKGVLAGAAVELGDDATKPPGDTIAPVQNNLRIVDKMPDGTLGFRKAGGGVEAVPGGTKAAFHVTLTVSVAFGGGRVDDYSGLELEEPHSRAIGKALQAEDPGDDSAVAWLDRPAAAAPSDSAALLAALLQQGDFGFLTGDNIVDADLSAGDLKGADSDPDDASIAATGLAALGEIDDIAIVACPDTVSLADQAQTEAVENLLSHCERLKYRIGLVDPPADCSISQVRQFRSQFDSKYGALYYPWIQILDPTVKNDPGAPPALLTLPPSGFTAGIYARSDIDRGVHKAPANEVVLGMTKLVFNVTFDRQAVLNPEGINALRFFEGRSNRVWGARTMSSDPEWKYVNVRRLFIFLEHSIEKATQWAVFEPNNERLWASIRQSIEDFLLVTWRTGALMGTKPEEAYFVRCDRTTMTQNDLDNGRLICLIGVAPTYPAEFVIFRIGQWTADAKAS
jgi:phage tail sheath protein FI